MFLAISSLSIKVSQWTVQGLFKLIPFWRLSRNRDLAKEKCDGATGFLNESYVQLKDRQALNQKKLYSMTYSAMLSVIDDLLLQTVKHVVAPVVEISIGPTASTYVSKS